MSPNEKPSAHRLGKAGAFVVSTIIAIFIIIFVGRNLWHGEELEQDQAVGNNVATEHTGPSYNQRP
ncbi:hypothetical protein [Sphingobium yanoikuyae]|uniref:hypothetical protein n=1 Tax=Sphingobium yanoikuyae TaxID=13690 RepID=UPI00289A20FD|nr:hypothetical protein [Sphingobium yanoikuyae]